MAIDFTALWEETIQSQFGTSPHLKGIIAKFAERVDPSTDVQTFFDKYFNPLTAEGVGLDIWGEIVQIGRYVIAEDDEILGFFGSGLQPFNQAPFVREPGATNLYRLADYAYRKLIFCKAYANISGSTIPDVKQLLKYLFGEETLMVQAALIGNMKVRLIYPYESSAFEFSLLKTYGILNLGAGVGVEFWEMSRKETFGFYGTELQPFNQGIFAPYSPRILPAI